MSIASPLPSSLRRLRGLLGLLLAAPLLAQMPEGWNQRTRLGADLPEVSSWLGAGVWAGHKNDTPATLIDSLGQGNSLVGAGALLEGGFRAGAWEGAGKLLLYHDQDGGSRLTLQQGHLTYTSVQGWRMGFENEPLVWGYGLTGGYLLGEAARPVPRLQLTTPPGHLSLFGVSLGDWTGQTFLGRLESRRRLADNLQNPSTQSRVIQANGEPEAPLLSGYRLEGSFYDRKVETYLNWTVLWGGTRDGVPMTRGYGLSEYLTAMTGTKDLLAETSTNFADPNHPDPSYKNGARSSTNFDFGVRGEVAFLARWLGAEQSWLYVSRGSKGMTWPLGVLVRRPLYWIGKDLEQETRNVLHGAIRSIWYESDRHLVPNLVVPDDAFGVLVKWDTVRVGLESRSTSNPAFVSYRSFQNSVYATGFYRDGDPLGEALGGETDTTTLRVAWDARPNLTSTVWVYAGRRPFRDDLTLWQLDHPGATQSKDGFTGLQADMAWRPTQRQALRVGASLERHGALGYVKGQGATGARYFLEWSTRWSNPIR